MSLLFKYRPLVINPELAARIGLNEAIVLQQINYWLTETNSGIEQEGIQWVYNTHKEWVKQFPFWSIDTVKRTLLTLEKLGCVRVEQLAKAQRDMTNYYTINYECDALNSDSKLPQSKGADCPDGDSNLPPSISADCPHLKRADCPDVHTEITETTTETTSEKRKRKAVKSSVFDFSSFPMAVSPEIWEDYLIHRKAKRAPMTQTVVNMLGKELSKAAAVGWSVDDSLSEAMAAGWQGLKFEWLQNRSRPQNQCAGNTGMSRQEALEAHNARVADDFVNDGW
ncbi:hypothetical protein ACOHX9_000673 [Yersinia enterocolitica]|uniref:hypothetical protein n=1 Tax=Yersinia enterocolitica TaxID=630 RepID=UPI001C60836A|nr:hypothetical protein [Yersinia enterocolitica]EKN6355965.1 hypothetical protein [Yersinia enterocolitica]MBW5855945.1 hypothetical protein [Yersinia enterocolitica]HDL7313787.1 hypothetical protein [Yersinia enterocolitica]HEI6904917.1 hypothetical protein [Yersinia enterocolitica]